MSSFSVFFLRVLVACVCRRVCLCVWCGVVPCGVVWHAENPVCRLKKRLRVSTFTTSPCMPAPRAYVFQHVRVLPAYTETF